MATLTASASGCLVVKQNKTLIQYETFTSLGSQRSQNVIVENYFIFERQYFGKRRRIVSISAGVTFNEVSSHKFTLTLPTLPFNPFFPTAPFLYPLKTSENRKVFCCFPGVEKGCIGNEWVKKNEE